MDARYRAFRNIWHFYAYDDALQWFACAGRRFFAAKVSIPVQPRRLDRHLQSCLCKTARYLDALGLVSALNPWDGLFIPYLSRHRAS